MPTNEAFITAYATFMCLSSSPMKCVKELIYTNGDPDTIATIGGVLVGIDNWLSNEHRTL